MKFANFETGEIIEINQQEARLSRLDKRLKFFSNWSDEVEEHYNVDKIMVTCTYRPGQEWTARDLTEFVRKVRRYLGSRLLGYFSVAEMQERGAVHYHVVLVVRKGTRIPKPDKEGYWTKGSTQVKQVGKVYAYLRKYLEKKEQKTGYPKGIRIFSFSIYVMKEGWKRFKFSAWVYDKINRLIMVTEDKLQRIALLCLDGLRKVSGGYECAGFFIASPYRFHSW